LWVGWFGFNPGSQLAFSGEANIAATMLIAVNTTLSGAAGAVAAMIMTSLLAHSHKLSLSMLLNGALAGLVGITANCDSVTNNEAIIIGMISGVLVVCGGMILRKFKIDDAVGAWPVHGLCGIWGGIAAGIFGSHALGVQILGSLVIPLWAFVTMFLFFSILKKTGILRVSREHELAGLDLVEHGEIEGE
jgi:Amt family ammonium transporter